MPPRHIGILLFDDVEELDAVGPWDVLAYWTREYPQDGWTVSCLSRDGAPVTAAKGLVRSLVYAAAGLLQGRPATTHWAALDELRELDSSIEIREHDRWVDDGDVITSAGVSAGIDMALHLVARLVGTDRARHVRRAIQYHPEPSD
jgi:transcriptional regulator GlxA family with amidase domain